MLNNLVRTVIRIAYQVLEIYLSCIHIFPAVQRNYDPDLHPLEAPREYARALNSVKLERIFAKPFIGNLDGHRDGVSCLAKHPHTLSFLASGAYDGEVLSVLWTASS